MKFTITGGSGVLGRNLIDRLSATGHHVTSLDIVPLPEAVRCLQILGDIRDEAAVHRAIKGADIVIHGAAALPSYRPSEQLSLRLIAHSVFHHGVDPDEKASGYSDNRCLGSFSVVPHLLIDAFPMFVPSNGDERSHIHRTSNLASAAMDLALSLIEA